MRSLTSRLAALALVTLAAAPLAHAADAKKILDVEVKLDDAKLVDKAAKIRVLFITLYDAAAAGPRPYGAFKVDLDKDAKGLVYKGTLDTTNVMVMGGGDLPAKLRVKAKLDKDGSAGPDAPGDLIGIVDGVAVGSKTVVTIDKAI